MNARLFRLMETHQRIDRALGDEMQRRRPDPLRTRQLKKLKLRVKDLMSRLQAHQATA
ncbi:YdcH family protein [Sphingomonas sp. LHG3406-1]|uniref:YdcH family protein n=1 Tax=Sphingomonas sp. LHG3406-1 TaxID=2804617 RepID=UPI002605C27A|nr:YdcH family protein [Sphingomonas sp. LHG3406-1]